MIPAPLWEELFSQKATHREAAGWTDGSPLRESRQLGSCAPIALPDAGGQVPDSGQSTSDAGARRDAGALDDAQIPGPGEDAGEAGSNPGGASPFGCSG